MLISDLKIVIENLTGSYKKFADSIDDYPVLGVTYPTHYGYIEGYASEDGHDLDVFIGNGQLFGLMRVKRDEIEGGLETKFLLGVDQIETDKIAEQFGPVVESIETFDQPTFFDKIQKFKR